VSGGGVAMAGKPSIFPWDNFHYIFYIVKYYMVRFTWLGFVPTKNVALYLFQVHAQVVVQGASQNTAY
jgi:hypothetical protein